MIKKLAMVFAALVASAALAAETPHEAWIKAKCAVCHGEDGSGNTPEGKRRKTPDLRDAKTQKRTDAELYDLIVSQHGKMPSFQEVSKARVSLLVAYIRSMKR